MQNYVFLESISWWSCGFRMQLILRSRRSDRTVIGRRRISQKHKKKSIEFSTTCYIVRLILCARMTHMLAHYTHYTSVLCAYYIILSNTHYLFYCFVSRIFVRRTRRRVEAVHKLLNVHIIFIPVQVYTQRILLAYFYTNPAAFTRQRQRRRRRRVGIISGPVKCHPVSLRPWCTR